MISLTSFAVFVSDYLSRSLREPLLAVARGLLSPNCTLESLIQSVVSVAGITAEGMIDVLCYLHMCHGIAI